MKRTKIIKAALLITIFMSVLTTQSYAQPGKTSSLPFDPVKAVQGMESQNRTFIDALRSGDSISLGNIYTHDAQILNDGIPTTTGTKPAGQGIGLNLSVSYDIATKGHNGELRVKTKEGQGSTFTIILPANEHNYD